MTNLPKCVHPNNVYEDEWIVIRFEKQSPKTKRFSVWNKCAEFRIGDVVYDNGWRHYVFQDGLIKLSDRCLLALNQFVAEQNRLSGKSYNKAISVDDEIKELSEIYAMCNDKRILNILKNFHNQMRYNYDNYDYN